METEEMKLQVINHFSHRHPLELVEVEEEDDQVNICSGCEVHILGSAYNCTKPSCDFILHDSCIDLPRKVKHNSHPKHPLILHFFPPYGDGEFTCNACGNPGHGFTYHCMSCKYDLHVECASLPEVEYREDHEHPFVLSYSFRLQNKAEGKGKGKRKAVAKEAELKDFECYVCHGPVEKGCWAYCCSSCYYCVHLECVN
ncbi:uncharacterized protein LOC113754375 [Coffea eugenioides]|uniref:uncharacterized protein LOC113754375 n=1 Tax=Coffea eugenioides TaxID=49369 RepID=UPI000F604DD9|nr:uncharacterized protein LOC113754375 [Coffea eugenioides]